MIIFLQQNLEFTSFIFIHLLYFRILIHPEGLFMTFRKRVSQSLEISVSGVFSQYAELF